MPETRVNLKHLLEDIRDSYPFPIEEAIVTELVANALDSGASEIRFQTDWAGVLTVVDNGAGMSPRMLKDYHDVATTMKERGKGIGFAGVGAKLSLLVASEVYTETRCGEFHGATRWRLRDAWHAPWQHTLITDLAPEPHGTAVRIELSDSESPLTDPAFIERVVRVHFRPLLDPEFMEKILRYIYEDGVDVSVDGKSISLPADRPPETLFFVRRGKRQRPAAVGYLRVSPKDLPDDEHGLAISTYGKVIRRGWEWLGIMPRHAARITGVVEVPELAAILTTNKADFLRDSTSSSRYYRYRRAIQRALVPVLRGLGELDAKRKRERPKVEGLEREIGRVLGDLVGEFPELRSLAPPRRPELPPVDRHRQSTASETASETGTPAQGAPAGDGAGRAPGSIGASAPNSAVRSTAETVRDRGPNATGDPRPDAEPRATSNGARRRNAPRRGGPVTIAFDDRPEREELGWLVGNTVCVNRGHPAYRRAVEDDAEDYHIALTAAWALSACLEDGGSPHTFVSRFLSNWSRSS